MLVLAGCYAVKYGIVKTDSDLSRPYHVHVGGINSLSVFVGDFDSSNFKNLQTENILYPVDGSNFGDGLKNRLVEILSKRNFGLPANQEPKQVLLRGRIENLYIGKPFVGNFVAKATTYISLIDVESKQLMWSASVESTGTYSKT